MINIDQLGFDFGYTHKTARHPAKCTDALMPVMIGALKNNHRILDPFSGTGKIFLLRHWLPMSKIMAVEIEPEWAKISAGSIIGDAVYLPFPNGYFDAICTSPTYGNRMADTLIDKYQEDRRTYACRLGKPLSKNNSGAMQWGSKYREFHILAWSESRRVLRPGGRFVLNIKDHVRDGKIQLVTDWHIQVLKSIGFTIIEHHKIECSGVEWGKNSDKKIAFESVIIMDLSS